MLTGIYFSFFNQQVPQFRPQAALHFLQMFLAEDTGGALLAPLMPTNATLTAMTDKAFNTLLDSWTEIAKSSDFVDVPNMIDKDGLEDENEGGTLEANLLEEVVEVVASSSYLRG